MKFPHPLLTLASIALLAISVSRSTAQDEPAPISPSPESIDAQVEPADCCNGARREWSGDYSELELGRLRHRGVCPDCGARHGLANGRIRGAVANVHNSVSTFVHSGQPLIDPAMQADWIAAQRAATMSWHGGYYHTQYGAPLALVVPPTARAHTRWSWGVAQSTMMPLYHQFERPYPGPVGSGGYGGAGGLLPTPRWPSHTDQFGVYYVRGPW